MITGSSRGFGRTLAEAVLAHGDQLVTTACNPQQLADLRATYGKLVNTIALDGKNPVQAREGVDAAVNTYECLDVVVNNAGYGNLVHIEEENE